MEKFGDGLKKIVLAGIGAVAATSEKSQELIDNLVKKGEITVEQGKVLNQELKHNIKSKVDEAKENVKNKKREASENYRSKEIADIIRDMSAEQIAQLQVILEKIKAEGAGKAEAETEPEEETVEGEAEAVEEEAPEQAEEKDTDEE